MQRRKTVLYVNSTVDLYGGSRALLDLISQLDRRTYMPIVILPSDGPPPDILRERQVNVTLDGSLLVLSLVVLALCASGWHSPAFW